MFCYITDMRTSSPQRDRAIAFLRTLPGDGAASVPSLRALARCSGVSLFTMHAAMRSLRAQQDSHLPEAARPAVPTAGTRWHTVAERLLREIALGRWHEGERLPGTQQLSTHFGVCAPTMRRALTDLQNKGVIRGRAIAGIGARAHRAGSASLVLLSACDTQGVPVVLSQRTEEFLRALERECTAAALGMHVEGYGPQERGLDPGAYTRRVLDTCRSRSAVGCVLLHSLIEPSTAISTALATAGMPQVVLEERPWQRPTPRSERVRMQTLRLGFGEEAGLALGRFIADLGHRSVAYVDAYPGETWSTLRLNGLREALTAAGGAIVHAPVDDRDRTAFASHLIGMSRRMAGQAVRLTSTPRAARSMQDTMEHLTYDEYLRKAVEALARRLTSCAGITAWVAANDQVALALRDLSIDPVAGIRAPAALCGFDNSEEARYYGLTTVDFNLGAAAHAAVAYLVRPAGARKAGFVLDVPVSVIPRVSTRPPPRTPATSAHHATRPSRSVGLSPLEPPATRA